jgi:ADP-ribose pyrophosphatase YjhB (NUDIX family)
MDKSNRILMVGVKAFIKNSSGKYLLLLRSEPYEGNTECKWDVPGGRIHIVEELNVALAREIKEETALVMKGTPQIIYAQDILRTPGRHVVRLTYTAKATGKIKLDPKEHQDFGWYTIEEIKKMYHDTYLDPVLKII